MFLVNPRLGRVCHFGDQVWFVAAELPVDFH